MDLIHGENRISNAYGSQTVDGCDYIIISINQFRVQKSVIAYISKMDSWHLNCISYVQFSRKTTKDLDIFQDKKRF